MEILCLDFLAQHIGGDAGRNKKVKIPARPYLKLGEAELNDIKTAAQKYLNN